MRPQLQSKGDGHFATTVASLSLHNASVFNIWFVFSDLFALYVRVLHQFVHCSEIQNRGLI